MKTPLILVLLALSGALLPAIEIPPEFRAKIVQQTAEQWKWVVRSSHSDGLIDAPPDSPHLGKDAAGVFKIEKIVISFHQPAEKEFRLTEATIYAALNDYVLKLPGPPKVNLNPETRCWIDVKGPENRDYRLEFENGTPTELYLRKDAQTLERFALIRKKSE
jgi:hypothetical protein